MIQVMLRGLLVFATTVAVIGGCMAQQVAVDPPGIGGAKMLPDGTIALHMRAEKAGTIGDAYFEVRPNDPTYEEIKRHVGELEPGDEKPVPPWPKSLGGVDQE